MGVKVLHIIWKANFGGIEKLVYELAQEQTKGDQVKPAVLVLKPEGEFLERFRNANFEYMTLNLKQARWMAPTQLQKLKQLIKPFDIIHLHSFNPWIFFLAVNSTKKIVYTEHGNFGFGRKPKLFDRFLLKMRIYGINHYASAVTYNSKHTKAYAETKLGYKKEAFSKVVYNGVDNQISSEETSNLSELKNCFVVGTWSRFAGFKRIDRLIKAFSFFQERKKTRLLLVGDGALMSELKLLCKKLNIEDKVIFTGFVPEPKSYIKQMDVCVFPSQQEPFGLVAIEALQNGMPTLVFQDGGGLVEIINPLSPDDVVDNEEELRVRMEYFYKLWQEGKIKNRKVINDRKKRAADFTISRISSQLEEIYLSL